MIFNKSEWSDTMPYNYRIKELLEKNHMTQFELAKRIKLTPTSLSRYLKGTQEPKLEVIVKMANVFNVSIDYLIGNDDNEYVSTKNRLCNNANYDLFLKVVLQLGELTNSQLSKVSDYVEFINNTDKKST
jgi:transcriptional regulator with XRE-family HTH domain